MRTAALGDIAAINPSPLADVWADGSRRVSFVPMAAVSEDGVLVSPEDRTVSGVSGGHTYFERGDILLAKITPCFENGKAALIEALPHAIGFGSTEFHVLRPGPDVEPRYLFHQLRSRVFRTLAVNAMVGSAGQKRVPSAFLERYRVPLPAIEDQRRVARVLDLVAEVRSKRRTTSVLLERYLEAAFLTRFGCPLRDSHQWPSEPLQSLAQVARGRFTPRPRNDPRFYDGSHPFVQTGDLSGSSGYLRAWRQTLNNKGASVSREFPKGTIAIAIAANIGDTAILDFDCFVPDSVVGIQVNASIACAEYVEYCLRLLKPALTRRAPMTAQRNINLRHLRPLRIPVPPLRLQRQFAVSYRIVYDLIARLGAAEMDCDALAESVVQHAFPAPSTAAHVIGLEPSGVTTIARRQSEPPLGARDSQTGEPTQ